MTITAIIAHMPLNEQLLHMTTDCVKAFRPLVDKLILIQNGTENTLVNADLELLSLADHYLINKHNRLHGGAINQGALLAKPGEYLAFINDDILPDELTRNSFEQLCRPGEILSPQIGNQSHSYGAHASFFVCDYETFHSVGYWNLSLGHIADEDWFKRAQSMGITMGKIDTRVRHDHPTSTIKLVTPPHFEVGEY